LPYNLRAFQVGLDRPDRVADDQVHTHGRRQVEDHVALAHQPVHDRLVRDRLVDELEAGVLRQVGDVGQPAGGQVVDGRNGLPLVEQGLGQVTPDEAGPAGDQSAHTHRQGN
jgi:hypothetical protein